MTLRTISLILLLVTFASCDKNKTSKIKIDNLLVEGNISKDSIYNGLIKFYDTTNQLIETANYSNGILNGNRIEFNKNGKKKSELHYENGKIKGNILYFDSLGEVSETQYRYYDLWVGPSISYKDRKIVEYSFHSLENKELLHLNYDSIKEKHIEQLNNQNFFFLHYNSYGTSGNELPKTELFIYLPNPPGLNFIYSLCIVDNNYNITQEVKVFKSEDIWNTVDLDFEKLQQKEYYAVKLTLNSHIDADNKTITMFKRL